jgi:hypothetical protein
MAELLVAPSLEEGRVGCNGRFLDQSRHGDTGETERREVICTHLGSGHGCDRVMFSSKEEER